MKKTFISISFIILSIMAFSQEQKIEGIGIFKIGKTTTSIIENISKQLNTTILESKDDKLYWVKRGLCPGYSKYIIPRLNISSFMFENIELIFFNDTLIRFKSDIPDSLNQALRIKYGKPLEETKEKEVICRYTYTGAEIKHMEQDLRMTWINNNIEAQIYYWKFYLSDCSEKIIAGFYVENKVNMAAIATCEKWIKDSQDFNKKKELEKRSDGL